MVRRAALVLVLATGAAACVPPPPSGTPAPPPSTSTTTTTTTTTTPPAWQLHGTVTTWIGGGGSCGTVDGDREHAGFRAPFSLTATPDGGLVVADALDGVLRRVAADGSVTTAAGSVGDPGLQDGVAGAARLDMAGTTIATDGDGRVVFTDIVHHVVRRLGPGDEVTTIAGVPWLGSVSGPFQWDGPAGNVHLLSPEAVAVDADGVLVADAGSRTIRRLRDTEVEVLWGGIDEPTVGTGEMVGFPLGVAVGDDGTVWVHDGFTAVYHLSPDGDLTWVAGQPGVKGTQDGPGDQARFRELGGMVIGPDGAAYVAGDETIRRITPAGEVTTVAGLAGTQGDDDGTGAEARFATVSSLAFAADGALYATDVFNCAIRRIT